MKKLLILVAGICLTTAALSNTAAVTGTLIGDFDTVKSVTVGVNLSSAVKINMLDGMKKAQMSPQQIGLVWQKGNTWYRVYCSSGDCSGSSKGKMYLLGRSKCTANPKTEMCVTTIDQGPAKIVVEDVTSLTNQLKPTNAAAAAQRGSAANNALRSGLGVDASIPI